MGSIRCWYPFSDFESDGRGFDSFLPSLQRYLISYRLVIDMTDTARPRKRKETLEQFRTGKFMGMGFAMADAERLAHARDHKGHHVDSSDVKKLLDNGCPTELAVEIMA